MITSRVEFPFLLFRARLVIRAKFCNVVDNFNDNKRVIVIIREQGSGKIEMMMMIKVYSGKMVVIIFREQGSERKKMKK